MEHDVSTDAMWIQEECGVSLQHVVNIYEDDVVEEVYDIVRAPSDVPLTLVIMRHKQGKPSFAVTYGMVQIPCLGIHTDEEIRDILLNQDEFPLPLKDLSRDSMHMMLSYSREFIEKFRSVS